jgi:hypothetical protein
VSAKWRELGPRSGLRWPATWASSAAAIGIGSALGALPRPLLAALAAVCVLLAAFASWWTLSQRRESRRRGSVYVVRERSAAWASDDDVTRHFIDALGTSFPEVRQVPGPAVLSDWTWPLDGAAHAWEQNVSLLVAAIRISRRGDDKPGQKSLVAWTPWPVAVAMMAQMRRADRGPGLLVRQRTSFGRSAAIETVDPRQPPLSFDAVPAAAPPRAARRLMFLTSWRHPAGVSPPRSEVTELAERPVCLQITRRPEAGAGPEVPATSVTVLLIRLGRGSWGPLAACDEADAESADLDLTVADASGIGVDGTVRARLWEWRCLPGVDAALDVHPWRDYEELARGAVSWIGQRCRESHGVVLLGAVMPQEIGLGIGILLRQRDIHDWPAHLYPLVWSGPGGFVIPRLDLGAAGFDG